ncbi:MAG: hypothetical protein M3Z02_02665 [Actinomycetota bacterium]|nr:hypothetical protein [Actinomycetota bacterium]
MTGPGRADDRVLPATRVLSLAIIPFLLVAFVDLFFWPRDTDRFFAWTIKPALTPLVLGSVYLGGAYFFARAAVARKWHTIKGGFLPVSLFATLMGLATVLHWDRFHHHHVAFWLWAGLYFTTPLLVPAVWWANHRHDVRDAADDAHVPLVARVVIAGVGVAASGMSLLLFLAPKRAISIWPWLLTPLTARVMGAIFALGIAGLGALVERRWSSVRLMVQVELLMLVLIGLGAARVTGDLQTDRVLTWLFGAGFLAVMVGSVGLYLRLESKPLARAAGAPHRVPRAGP